MDRRTFPYAIAALAVWILWTVVVPGVNRSVPWNDPIRPGDTLQVTPDVTVTPTVGWGLRSGLRTSDRTASGVTSDDVVLASDGVQFQITTGPWTGTPAELLQQITTITTTVAGGRSLQITGGVNTVETTSGDTGVLETFSSPRTQGVIAAFVFDAQGLQVQAVGPPPQVAAHARDIENMITSIRHDRARG